MVTHHNIIQGVYAMHPVLCHTSSDHLLSVLPLSFDAGFNQIALAFLAGATVVLARYWF